MPVWTPEDITIVHQTFAQNVHGIIASWHCHAACATELDIPVGVCWEIDDDTTRKPPRGFDSRIRHAGTYTGNGAGSELWLAPSDLVFHIRQRIFGRIPIINDIPLSK